MGGFDTPDRAGRGAWAAAVAVTEAAIVLMFSKKKDDVEEVFWCCVSDFWAGLGQSLFLCNLSIMIVLFFLGTRWPAILQ